MEIVGYSEAVNLYQTTACMQYRINKAYPSLCKAKIHMRDVRFEVLILVLLKSQVFRDLTLSLGEWFPVLQSTVIMSIFKVAK